MAEKSQNTDMDGLILICAGLALAGFFYIYNEHFYIFGYIWKYTRLLEAKFLYFYSLLPFVENDYGRLVDYAKAIHPKDLGHDFIAKLNTTLWVRLSWLPAGILFFLAWRMKKKDKHVTKEQDVESILKEKAEIYPHLKPYVDNHPEKMNPVFERGDPDHEFFSMEVTPMGFATANPPLGLESESKKNKAFRKPILDRNSNQYDVDLCTRSFEKQLGSKFTGLQCLKPHEEDLFHLMVEKMKPSPDYFFKALSVHYVNLMSDKVKPDEHFNYSYDALIQQELKPIIKQLKKNGVKLDEFNPEEISTSVKRSLYKNNKLVSLVSYRMGEEAMFQHAYTRVGFITLYQIRVNSMPLASAPLKTLIKRKDRILWVVISSYGRDTPFPEAAGCYAHWNWETRLGRMIPQPQVADAVRDLRLDLKVDQLQAEDNFDD